MLREIVRPKDRHLKIDIPQEYVDQEIEILVLPLFEVDSSSKEEDNGYDEDLMRLFENAPNVKVDKEVDIDQLMNEVNDVVL